MITGFPRLLLAAFLLLGCPLLSAFSKDEALALYSQIDNVEFPVKSGDCLFFRCKWKASPEATQEELEAEQLDAQFSALEKYICKGLQELRIQQSPFGEKLTRLILPSFNFKLSEIAMVTVKEAEQAGERFCVFACNPSVVKALKDKVRAEALEVKNYSEAQWAVLLKKAFDGLEREEDRRSFLTLLGCPIVVYLRERGIRFVGMDFDVKSQAAWKEICKLLSWSADDAAFFLSRKDSQIWKWVWATKGNVDFSNAPHKDNGEFDAGKSLYHQGKDIPKIMELFGRSIELAPNSHEKWRYLGGILRVNKQYRDSLIAYLQAAKLENPPKEDLKTMQMLCKECGMSMNADGLRWYILMIDL